MSQIISFNLPANRSFGFLFAALFLVLSAYANYNGQQTYRVYGYLISGVAVGIVSVFAPNLLTPLNKSWMKLGDLISNIANPFVLGVIFFLLITPTALITRLFGRDELRLEKTEEISYWIDRTPHGPDGDSFKNQF
jgi:hypothetical protein